MSETLREDELAGWRTYAERQGQRDRPVVINPVEFVALLDRALATPFVPAGPCADCGGDHASGHPWHTPPVPAGDERERLAERLAGTGSYDFTVQLVDWGDEYREFMLAQADRLLAAGVRLTEGSNQ